MGGFIILIIIIITLAQSIEWSGVECLFVCVCGVYVGRRGTVVKVCGYFSLCEVKISRQSKSKWMMMHFRGFELLLLFDGCLHLFFSSQREESLVICC